MAWRRWLAPTVAAVIVVALLLGAAWYGTRSDVDDTHRKVEQILNESG